MATTNTAAPRDTWGSKLGFVMAAAGSAVGLGNIWKFPYTAGESGGGAFVAIYLFFVIFIGFSVMLTEFAIGRKTGLSAVGAFKSTDRRWTFTGVIGVFSGLLIMGFYPVVGGWALAYIFKVGGGLLARRRQSVTALVVSFLIRYNRCSGWGCTFSLTY